jgi:hypothetical protein
MEAMRLNGVIPARLTRLAVLTAASVMLGVLAPAAAHAQYSHLLFLEAARDPGRADVAQSARQLAMGSGQTGDGSAEAAAAAPATLTLRSGIDMVVSFGGVSFSRDELVLTPGILPPAHPARRRSGSDTVPVMQIAAATRRGNWAAAGFLERGSRYSHAFATDRAELRVSPLAGAVIIEAGSGSAQIQQTIARVGGAVAAGNARYGFGASLYAVHIDHTVNGVTRIDIAGRFLPTDPLIVRCCVDESDRVSFDNRSMGLSVGGHIGAGEHVSVSGRWRHEPRFTTTRQIRRVGLDNDQELQLPFDFVLDLPDTLAAGLAVRGSRFTVTSEWAWHTYGSAYSPTGPRAPGYESCQPDDVRMECGNFPNYSTRSAFTLRSGVERAFQVDRGQLLLRGGLAYEPGYTLARETRSLARSPSLPPLENDWEPPREPLAWLTGGVAYSWRHAEIGIGAAFANGQMRVLADLKLARTPLIVQPPR